MLTPSHLVVQSLSHVQLFATPWTAAHQASLSLTISQSLLKLMSVASVMPSNNLNSREIRRHYWLGRKVACDMAS